MQRAAFTGGTIAVAIGFVLSSPLLSGLLGGAMMVDALIGIYQSISNHEMANFTVPDRVVIEQVSQPHQSRIPRHGIVVTATLHNTAYYLRTPSGDTTRSGGTPMYLACLVGGAPHATTFTGRVALLTMDWITDKDFYPSYPSIEPGATRAVDFVNSTKFGFTPISPDEIIQRCVIGGTEFQTLMQFDMSPSDPNKGAKFHYRIGMGKYVQFGS